MAQKYLFSVFDVTKQVFYTTPLSIGIVNLKPLLPGHVLIIPKRVVPRLSDLNPPEISDLFMTVQKVGKGLEKYYHAQALTISLQDGASAGQSVPHVHVHILPRHSTDFEGENDRIYPLLEKNELHLREDLQVSRDRNGDQELESGEMIGGGKHHLNNGDGQISGNGNGLKSQTKIGHDWNPPLDEDRKPRSMEEMIKEAKAFEEFFKGFEMGQ
ncbi:hypothetical protein I302_101901 [Kwoniella bestiolae CBS 10118]|uniref:Bis(5'-adenosyl)-triphosphatase n=1 Tax=Kwoniella bestiolae CBS 10118 TaxID=1296100 RepID=A0A1B9GDK0_9TREE|nr:bis(5'-adenosyl)-triphosphatase [Kwoniella bestiolae CBS 10118]OCF29090.1 bis(5'-adenosyl)-triphosphatase [Kwoniella bestiolae CBS 10118]